MYRTNNHKETVLQFNAQIIGMSGLVWAEMGQLRRPPLKD